MSFKLSNNSLVKLQGVDPRLVECVKLAITRSTQDFSVLEGLRSKERQALLVADGKSQTMDSRHLTGHAVDLVPYPVSWEWEQFYPIADAMIWASKQLQLTLRWGGNWKVRDVSKWDGNGRELAKLYTGKFPDGPHWEIPR